MGVILRLENLVQKKFVANPWTLQQKAQTTQMEFGPFRAYNVGAGRGTRTHTPAKVADFKSVIDLFTTVH